MGREVRMVPKDWEHPKRESGDFIALHDSDFIACTDDWNKECARWNAGEYPDYVSEDSKKMSYEEWAGGKPEEEDYMPTFPEGTATHCMMYETTTEGTPISPAFESPEQLARWLYENEASSFGSRTASYESWLRVAKGGFACSMVIDGGQIKSGVEEISRAFPYIKAN